jgi:hypothetical protein
MMPESAGHHISTKHSGVYSSFYQKKRNVGTAINQSRQHIKFDTATGGQETTNNHSMGKLHNIDPHDTYNTQMGHTQPVILGRDYSQRVQSAHPANTNFLMNKNRNYQTSRDRNSKYEAGSGKGPTSNMFKVKNGRLVLNNQLRNQ